MNGKDDIPEVEAQTEDEEEALAPFESTEGETEEGLEIAPGSMGAGAEVIRRQLKTAPNGPGVYRMFAANGDVLYVGKARNIRARISAYARGQAHTNRIARMIAETASMEFVTTATETEALLLEANLIKQLKPRYNVLLRDDKSFPYILVTKGHAASQITKHRGARSRPGDYYGPFASVWAVNRTLNALQRAFLLRSCSDSFYENRTRPCLLFQIKRCSGPCTGEISHTAYAELVQEGRDFPLRPQPGGARAAGRGDAGGLRRAGVREGRAPARSNRRALGHPVEPGHQPAIDGGGGRVRARPPGGACLRRGLLLPQLPELGQPRLFPQGRSGAAGRRDPRRLPRAVLRRQADAAAGPKPTPRLVLLSHEVEDQELLREALSARAGSRLEIIVPKRGEKRDLVAHAAKNSAEALARRLADTSSQEKLLASLGAAFGLERPPRRVEVYDNSHIMGTNAIGAMIVAGSQGFMKTHYRTFNIRSEELTPGDDYGMMREVLKRRFTRLVKENPRAASSVELGAGLTSPSRERSILRRS